MSKALQPVATEVVHELSTERGVKEAMSTRRPIRFTVTYLESLRPKSKQWDITDPATSGLVMRIEPEPNGSKSWLYRYQWRGEDVRLSIGPFPETTLHGAREIAGEWRKLRRKKIDPRTTDRGKRMSGNEVVSVPVRRDPITEPKAARSDADGASSTSGMNYKDKYELLLEADDNELRQRGIQLELHSFEFLTREFYRLFIKTQRKVPEYVKYIIKATLLPKWQGRDARTIKPREVVEMLDVIVERGSKVMANRIAAVTGQLFMYGIHRSILEDSPVKLLYKPGGKEKPRKRALSAIELASFLQNVHKVCRSVRQARIFTIFVLTLKRRSELALAEWEEFDFVNRQWRIPPEHCKGNRGQVLPLTDWVIEELQTLKRTSGDCRFVIPNRAKTAAANPKLLTRSVDRLQARFKKFGIDEFTLHDLRRTGRTGLAKLKVPKRHAECVLNHVANDEMEDTYDVHDYFDEMRVALEKWEAHCKTLLAMNLPGQPAVSSTKSRQLPVPQPIGEERQAA